MHIDRLVRSRRKTIALMVQRDGSLLVRAPLNTSARQIQSWVDKKVGWIEEKRAEISQRRAKQTSHVYRDGEKFLFLGKPYPLNIVNQAEYALSLDDHFYFDRSYLPKIKQIFTFWFRQQALRIMTERVAHYAKAYGFSYTQVKISSAVTRWGSCSSKGSLNFTWRLVMAPLDVIDYVVIHELVHTRIRNHSGEFWSAVRAIMPDYQNRVEWLKLNGVSLNLD